MKMTFREALREGMKRVMENEPRVFLIGEDVGAYGGAYAVSKGFLELFGPKRILDAPLSEAGFTGFSIGAAMGGMRPIVEIMTVNFSLLALDQIINSAAFLHSMSGGEFCCPMIIRMATGGGRQLSCQHSNSLEGWLSHIPGLKILSLSTVQDALLSLSCALREKDPVLIFEHALLLNSSDEVEEHPSLENLFKGKIRTQGDELTLITYGGMLPRCLEASRIFTGVEVVDLRGLRPLDEETILTSVKKTKRALIVDEGWRSGSLSAEISARIMENCFYDLKSPVQRLCRREAPLPYARHLEEALIPQVQDIKDKIKEILV